MKKIIEEKERPVRDWFIRTLAILALIALLTCAVSFIIYFVRFIIMFCSL